MVLDGRGHCGEYRKAQGRVCRHIQGKQPPVRGTPAPSLRAAAHNTEEPGWTAQVCRVQSNLYWLLGYEDHGYGLYGVRGRYQQSLAGQHKTRYQLCSVLSHMDALRLCAGIRGKEAGRHTGSRYRLRRRKNSVLLPDGGPEIARNRD